MWSVYQYYPAPRIIAQGGRGNMQPRRRRLIALGLAGCILALGGLSFYSQYPPCGGYPGWEASPYVLPYPVRDAYRLHQGNCTFGGHHGPFRYSYDFLMPVGSTVTAARAGVVVEILQGPEEPGNIDNWVKIRHADGTIAAYSHLLRALVRIGDVVEAGDPLGLSGNTGRTGGVPHLHFHVTTCSEPVSCGTLPVTFRNAGANSARLRGGQVYQALEHDLPRGTP
jgi:murein DD-endopeptidase MepM/ murein hydrolase activator NlpD